MKVQINLNGDVTTIDMATLVTSYFRFLGLPNRLPLQTDFLCEALGHQLGLDLFKWLLHDIRNGPIVAIKNRFFSFCRRSFKLKICVGYWGVVVVNIC